MRRIAAVSLFVLLASLSTTSLADASPWYVGLAAGRSDYGSIPGTSGNASGGSVLGGYQVNTWFGLEASYFDLGSASYTGGFTTCCTPNGYSSLTIVGKTKLTGESLDAVFRLDLQRGFFAFGKVGLALSHLDQPATETYYNQSLTGGVTNTVTSTDNSANKTGPMYTAGFGYAIGASWAMRLGWTRYHNVGDTSTGEGNISLLHLDLLYRF